MQFHSWFSSTVVNPVKIMGEHFRSGSLQTRFGQLFHTALTCETTWLRQVPLSMDYFTVVCLIAWPLNESEAGVDVVLIQTSLLFLCRFLLISMRTASLT